MHIGSTIHNRIAIFPLKNPYTQAGFETGVFLYLTLHAGKNVQFVKSLLSAKKNNILPRGNCFKKCKWKSSFRYLLSNTLIDNNTLNDNTLNDKAN
jgi:hypothetical protein